MSAECHAEFTAVSAIEEDFVISVEIFTTEHIEVRIALYHAGVDTVFGIGVFCQTVDVFIGHYFRVFGSFREEVFDVGVDVEVLDIVGVAGPSFATGDKG